MKIVMEHDTSGEDGWYDWESFTFKATTDDGTKTGLSIAYSVDCPEDNCFGRNMPGGEEILALIEAAYQAGKAGESWDFEKVKTTS